MKILTVDDSRMVRTLIRKYLSSLNLEVIEASDGASGLELVHSDKPDLIILDVNMPVMNGPEMLKKVRENDSSKDIPVLMLTAESSRELVVDLIQLGISDYIIKPFEEDLLKKKICKILGIGNSTSNSGKGNGVKRKILVLDDNESVLLVVRKFLTGVAEVLTTTSPEMALQLAEQYTPQVILLDLQTDGLQTFQTLKDERSLESTRYVVMLTKSTSDQASSAKEAGFSDVLLKPFDKSTLNQIVAQD